MKLWFILVLLALTNANPAADLVTAANLKALFDVTIAETIYSGYLMVDSV